MACTGRLAGGDGHERSRSRGCGRTTVRVRGGSGLRDRTGVRTETGNRVDAGAGSATPGPGRIRHAGTRPAVQGSSLARVGRSRNPRVFSRAESGLAARAVVTNGRTVHGETSRLSRGARWTGGGRPAEAVVELDFENGRVEVVVQHRRREWLLPFDDPPDRDECRPVDRSAFEWGSSPPVVRPIRQAGTSSSVGWRSPSTNRRACAIESAAFANARFRRVRCQARIVSASNSFPSEGDAERVRFVRSTVNSSGESTPYSSRYPSSRSRSSPTRPTSSSVGTWSRMSAACSTTSDSGDRRYVRAPCSPVSVVT